MSPAERLDSWKEIASYLQRSVRTVQRWEKEEGLPVRRLQHRKQGSVFALPHELDDWLEARATGAPPAPLAPAREPRAREPVTLAVLPFASLGDGDRDAGFCEGLTEEVINSLANLPGLRVASRTSTSRHRGPEVDLRTVGRELGVQAILEGSVRRAGDRARITAQLIDAAGDFHLWSHSWDRRSDDALALQEEIAGAIATRLREELAEHLGAAPASRSGASGEAYRAYLKGRHRWKERTLAGFEAAVRFFEEALELDAEHAPAWAGLADCQNMLGYYSHRPPREVFPRARDAAERALALDPDLAVAHASLGFTSVFHDHDVAGGLRWLERALELDPDDPVAHHWYGLCLGVKGRFFEAIEQVRKARELDPTSPLVNTYVAGAYYFGRQFGAAAERCRTTLELEPDFFLAHLILGWARREQGHHDDALRHLRHAVEISPESVDALAHLGLTLAVAGDEAGAREVLEQIRALEEERYVSPGQIALLYTGLGRKRDALRWLRKAVEERYSWLVFLRLDPVFDRLRGTEELGEIIEELGI